MCLPTVFQIPSLLILLLLTSHSSPSDLLLVSGGTGLAPILQALRIALATKGTDSDEAEGRGGFSSVVLVHSARSKRDLALLDEIESALTSNAGATPTSVHIAITSGERDGVEDDTIPARVPFTQSRGRVTEDGLLGRLWQGKRGMCVVSGPEGMLQAVGRVALGEMGFARDQCHLLEA